MSFVKKYCANNDARLFEAVINSKGKTVLSRILLGSWIDVDVDVTDGDWFKVKAFNIPGWMNKNDLTDETALKVSFLDVGQGDGVLIEIGNLRFLVDAGKDANMYNYLTAFHFKSNFQKGEKVHIDYLIVSHFDQDHFKGFTKIINDERFTFGEVCHAGILKFLKSENPYNTELGDIFEKDRKKYLTKLFDDLITVNEPAKFNTVVTPFITALKSAKTQNRVNSSRRYRAGDVLIDKTINNKRFIIEILAPFFETVDGKECCVYLENDEGKTINGHSIVLKLKYGERTYLLGGDLTKKSQEYLMEKYDSENPFEVDVAKSCHHGSEDFSVKFMKLVNPYATVISSGDNESYSHPRAEAIGCAGKYSRGEKPLVFSTELARSSVPKMKIIFGMINSRCDGKRVFFSQMKENHPKNNLFDSYQVDFR